jgi:hypothetical protein
MPVRQKVLLKQLPEHQFTDTIKEGKLIKDSYLNE